MAKSVKINGVTYADVPQVDIPLADNSGDDATFYETSGASVSAGDVKQGVTFHGANGADTGTMSKYESGADDGDISTVAGTVPIGAGYHDGSGSVGIASAEQAKIVSGNIRNGVTVLGVSGKSTVVDTEIASDGAAAGQILSGKKAYVNGSIITGSMTAATVSQDSTTKVLSIE